MTQQNANDEHAKAAQDAGGERATATQGASGERAAATQDADGEPKKVDRRKARSDEAIRHAFSELLAEKPFEKITVKELTDRAGIDRKTFYLRYSSIDEFIDRHLHEEMEHVAAVLADTAITRDGEFDSSKILATLGRELSSNLHDHPTAFKHVNSDRVIQRLNPIMTEELTKKDSLGLADELGPYLEAFVSFFCGGILSLCRPYTISDDQLPLDELIELTNAAITGGIASLSEEARSLGVKDTVPAHKSNPADPGR